MLLFLVKNYNYVMHNHAEKVGVAGAVLLLLPVVVYLEAPGAAWIVAIPSVFAGLCLLALNWYWSR